ncbi:MAG: hypothetical protein ACREKL_15020 [Chthoniobacterales bacterium]
MVQPFESAADCDVERQTSTRKGANLKPHDSTRKAHHGFPTSRRSASAWRHAPIGQNQFFHRRGKPCATNESIF